MGQKDHRALHPGFSVEVLTDYQALSGRAAQRVIELLQAKPDLLLCAAGGETPAGMYRLLAEQFQQNAALFQSLRVLKVDEWGGLSMDDPGSCETQLRAQLLGPLAVSNDQ
jgi:galactosamine-6-phosphate isomerase